MLRPYFVVAAIGAITLVLLPFQAIAVALRLPLRRKIPSFYHRLVCAILGVRVRVHGRCISEHPLLIVANHSSWLDIPVITSVAPVVFVAKQEIAGWPIFGTLARLQRSVFVDRTRRHKTRDVNAEIAQRLAEGDPVLLFGEGGASDGNRPPTHMTPPPMCTSSIGTGAHDGRPSAMAGNGLPPSEPRTRPVNASMDGEEQQEQPGRVRHPPADRLAADQWEEVQVAGHQQSTRLLRRTASRVITRFMKPVRCVPTIVPVYSTTPTAGNVSALITLERIARFAQVCTGFRLACSSSVPGCPTMQQWRGHHQQQQMLHHVVPSRRRSCRCRSRWRSRSRRSRRGTAPVRHQGDGRTRRSRQTR